MKTLDEIYAAALAVDPVSYRVGNEKFERFVKCATPVAVTGMIDEIRSIRQQLEAAQAELDIKNRAFENAQKLISAKDEQLNDKRSENERLQSIIKKALEQEPIAYQYGFEGDESWNGWTTCSRERYEYVLTDAKQWQHGYRVRKLYAHPPIHADHSEDVLEKVANKESAEEVEAMQDALRKVQSALSAAPKPEGE